MGTGIEYYQCVVTMILMMFMLPAGIVDGILAGSALVLMLMQYYGHKNIAEDV